MRSFILLGALAAASAHLTGVCTCSDPAAPGTLKFYFLNYQA